MVTNLDDTLGSSMALLQITDTGNRPTSHDQVQAIDDVVARKFGFALRFGMGASSSLNQYEYGYLTLGNKVNSATLGRVEDLLKEETHVESPAVYYKPVERPSEEELAQMQRVGTPPGEVLSALSGLRSAVEDEKRKGDK